METNRVAMYCLYCGSQRVTRDATAIWNIQAQTWELSGVHDQAQCDQCGDVSTLGEAPLNKLEG